MSNFDKPINDENYPPFPGGAVAGLTGHCPGRLNASRKDKTFICHYYRRIPVQEVFTGADAALVGNEEYVRDTALTRSLYWDSTAELRRRKLLPFFWNTIAGKGRLYGNRLWGNKVNVKNWLKISYPGYNEIFTGHTDAFSSPNLAINQQNT